MNNKQKLELTWTRLRLSLPTVILMKVGYGGQVGKDLTKFNELIE